VTVDLPAADPGAGAEAYADAVLAAVAAYDDVVLVGHVLAGLTVPLVAWRRPVRRMVLVSPVVAHPEVSFAEQLAVEPDMIMPGLAAGQSVDADGTSAWQPQAAIATLYPDAAPTTAEWAAGRLRRQAWRITRERSPLPAWPDTEVRMVACAHDGVVNPDWVRRAARVRFGVEASLLPGDHAPFLARPAELVDLIVAA
jgi:hypothetical protein